MLAKLALETLLSPQLPTFLGALIKARASLWGRVLLGTQTITCPIYALKGFVKRNGYEKLLYIKPCPDYYSRVGFREIG